MKTQTDRDGHRPLQRLVSVISAKPARLTARTASAALRLKKVVWLPSMLARVARVGEPQERPRSRPVGVLIHQRETNKQPHHEVITLYIGLDVHKDSIAIAIAEPGPKGEIRLFGTITNDLGRLEHALGG
jgi:hypothetical protein